MSAGSGATTRQIRVHPPSIATMNPTTNDFDNFVVYTKFLPDKMRVKGIDRVALLQDLYEIAAEGYAHCVAERRVGKANGQRYRKVATHLRETYGVPAKATLVRAQEGAAPIDDIGGVPMGGVIFDGEMVHLGGYKRMYRNSPSWNAAVFRVASLST